MFNDKLFFKNQILGNNKRIIILDTVIDVLDYNDTIKLVEKYIITKTPLHLIGVNADKINQVNSSETMRNIVNNCGIINADGASVVLASKFLKKPLPERVAGIDLMENLIGISNEKNYSIYLLGSKQYIVEKTAEVLKKKYHKLNIVGVRNGYFDIDYWEKISLDLKLSSPDIVFVGITSPNKEYLINYLQKKGHKCVFMGVGGSFDVISGSINRAPIFMQKCNLEWLYRIYQEPKRLFKRYMIGNFIFIRNVIKEKIINLR